MIGIRELILLMILFGITVIVVIGIVWGLRSASKPLRPSRTAAERLAELESLRKAEQITATEYERQRAAIVASV